MGFEVEMKFRTSESHAELAQRLAAMGAAAGPVQDQEDIYLSHPARDFAQTGEALRVRREGSLNRLTYKGPRHAGPTKTREEIEIAFAAGAGELEKMKRLWQALGFRPVAVLHKRRQPFHLNHRGRAIEVVLDVARDLGAFAEVEALASDSADLAAAQAAVLDLARVLGLSEVEPRSYLRMALELRGQAGGTPATADDADDPRNLAGQT
jgi:adenylate cyclase class 2